MTTKSERGSGEHPEVIAARERLARARREAEGIRAKIAATDRGRSWIVGPLVDALAALVAEERDAEEKLRALWTTHVGSPLIEKNFPAVLAAMEDYIDSVRTMHATRDRAVQSRAAFVEEFQSAHRGVPGGDGWSSMSLVVPPVDPPMAISSEVEEWARRIRAGFEAWRRTNGGA